MQSEKQEFIPALGANWATKYYDPLVRIFTKEYPFKRALISQANLNNNQTILDLACGTGTLSVGIKKRFPDTKIYAVDADKKVLGIARQKAKDAGIKISFHESLSHKLPFQNETFDRIFSTLFFHHLTIDKKIETLREIKRLLKPNGEFYIADYGKPNNIFQKASSNIIKLIDGLETTKDNLDGNLEKIIKEQGFTVELTKQFKTLLGTIYLYKCKIHR